MQGAPSTIVFTPTPTTKTPSACPGLLAGPSLGFGQHRDQIARVRLRQAVGSG